MVDVESSVDDSFSVSFRRNFNTLNVSGDSVNKLVRSVLFMFNNPSDRPGW